MAGKREEYLSWDEYFMSISSLAALRSKNLKGACIVGDNDRILSVGYEGIPCSIHTNNEEFSVSALSNALYDNFGGSRKSFEDSRLYLSHFPNYEESRQIVQARMSKVFYLFKDVKEDVEKVSRKILQFGGVKLIPYHNKYYSYKEYISFLKELKDAIKENIGKEKDTIINDEYFMGIVGLSALRSKDPSTQVGSCLVDKENRILSVGYNGSPFGMSDEDLPWESFGEQTGDLFTTKDPYAVHAEINAFDNYSGNQSDLKDSKLYLIYSPCVECSKRMLPAHLEKVIYLREYTKNNTSIISKKWLDQSRTIVEPYYYDRDIKKEDCIKFLDDTQYVIKKHLTR